MKLSLLILILILFPLSGLCQEEDQIVEEAIQENTQRSSKYETINQKLNAEDLSPKPISSTNLFDEKAVREMQELLKKNPLAQLPSIEVKNLILEKASSRPTIHRFLKNSPRLMNCLVDLVQDERAMMEALNIFINKEQLKVYGIIWLILFLIQWMFKKIFFKKNWGLFTRFTMSLLVGLIFTTVSLGIFYRLFKEELTPTVQIIGKHWKSK